MKFSFRTKLWLPLLLSVMALLIIYLFGNYQLYEARLQERKTALKEMVDVSLHMVRDYHRLVENKVIDTEAAQRQALQRIKSMRFGTEGHIRVLSTDAFMIMNPLDESMDGQDASQITDVNGVNFHAQLAQLGRDGGTGYVSFLWPHARGGEPVEKIAYAVGFEPWGWVMNAGVYVDDIHKDTYESLLIASVVVLVIVLFLAVVMTYLVRSIIRELGGEPEQVRLVAQEISQGNLMGSSALSHARRDSVLGTMDIMRQHLAQALAVIQLNADNIRLGAESLNTGNHELSGRTVQQAAALQETASAMEQMHSTVHQSVAGMKTAEELMQELYRITAQTSQQMQKLDERMQSIATASSKVGEITGVIDSIAFQTNILALNAAVEAARAGEQGRGFNVVAAEVRALAQRTTAAAREITQLIQVAQGTIDEGGSLMQQVNAAIALVVTSAEQAREIMLQLTQSSNEQGQGIAQINTAVGQLDTSTQQNAEMVQAVYSTSENISQQALGLTELLKAFRIEGAAVRSAQF